jgi:hypothetical protein
MGFDFEHIFYIHSTHLFIINTAKGLHFVVKRWATIYFKWHFIHVCELMGWVHNVVLMNVYLDLENPGGVGISGEGPQGAGEGNGESVYEQPGKEVDGSCHSKEGSK